MINFTYEYNKDEDVYEFLLLADKNGNPKYAAYKMLSQNSEEDTIKEMTNAFNKMITAIDEVGAFEQASTPNK